MQEIDGYLGPQGKSTRHNYDVSTDHTEWLRFESDWLRKLEPEPMTIAKNQRKMQSAFWNDGDRLPPLVKII